jgi:tetratricopeptide (TPR) repeat protein
MTVKATAALLALTLTAATAGAQARPPRGQGGAQRPAAAAAAQGSQCDIQSSGSAQVTGAYEALSKFNETESATERPRLLTQATRLMTSPPDRQGIDVARNWVLAQTLVAWTLVEGHPSIGKRSSFGFASNPDATVDLLVQADSLLDAVQAAKPGCASQIDGMRRLPYVTTVNQAVALFNAGNVDSAKVLAERSLVIYPEGAPTYHLLGNVAVKQQDMNTAAQMLQRAADLAKTDSTLREMRQAALESLALIYQNLATAAEGAQKTELAGKAVATYRELVALQPNNAALQTGLAQALSLSGDTAAVASMYAKMLAEPAAYSSMQLLDAGIGALNADRSADAVKLLEAGLAKNPHYRDGLFALVIAYSQTQAYDKMAAAAHRLIAVDPSNPDNHAYLSQAYQGLLSVATDNGAKRAYTDSLVKTQARAERMPVKVAFTDFQVSSGDQRVLNGMVENRGTAPADYVLKFEFVDEKGTVVATKEETVSAVPPKGSKPFSIAVQGQGIAAFRYAPLVP